MPRLPFYSGYATDVNSSIIPFDQGLVTAMCHAVAIDVTMHGEFHLSHSDSELIQFLDRLRYYWNYHEHNEQSITDSLSMQSLSVINFMSVNCMLAWPSAFEKWL